MTSDATLYCPIRKVWIAALPEEHVRQRVLNHMVETLGFPPSLIAVEKSLRQLPHLSVTDRRQVPDRRADIICYSKQEGIQTGLQPLLVVECKAIPLSPRVINQVVGYNHFIQAAFIVLASPYELRTGWYDPAKKEYVFVDYLPPYEQLCASISPAS